MDNKAKGNRRERMTRDFLERLGYSVVKAGGSLGLFDLIAVGPLDVLLIQVKSNRWPRPAEMRAMAELRAPAFPIVKKVVYRWDDRKATPYMRDVEGGPEDYPDGAGRRKGDSLGKVPGKLRAQLDSMEAEAAYINRAGRD
jgi:hypothetical protein